MTATFYADSMAFIGQPGTKPSFEIAPRPRLNLAHLTSVPPFIRDPKMAESTHSDFYTEILGNKNVKPVFTKGQLAGLSQETLGVVIGMQHAPDEITDEIVWKYSHMGVRTMGLAYDGTTSYGGGFLVPSVSLTRAGRTLLHRMADCTIILDISHCGYTTALEALRYIRDNNLRIKPMASHAGVYDVFSHERNMRTDILVLLRELDGYIGIPLLSFLLGPVGTHALTELQHHVTLAAAIMGEDRVGIGSDCPHMDMNEDEARAAFARMKAMIDNNGKFGAYFPDRPPEITRRGTQMFRFLEMQTMLMDHVPGILGDNFRNFLMRALP